MKIIKNSFDNYINNYNNNIHKNNELLNITNLQNLIIYGREGIGKYTETLNFIKKFSPSELKYEKKIAITNNKNDIFIKISDIHYEIDFQLLGYNSKILFNDIYNQIIDIVSTKKNKIGILLCKNFEYIDTELLDLFYSYMQNNINTSIHLYYIIITNNYSFLPNNIINICKIISFKVPAKYNYKKILNKNPLINNNLNDNLDNTITNINDIYIKNIKDILYLNSVEYNNNYLYNIYNNIINNNIEFNTLRNDLYELLIYKINLNTFIWDLLELLIINNKIKENHINNIINKTFEFFIQYNNNYRPIFHLENYILYLLKIVNGI